MNLFKNKEVRITVSIMAAVGAAAASICLFFDYRASVAAACVALALVAVYLIEAKKRFSAMRELSDSLDLLLDGREDIDLSRYSEGELSILENELSKLTVRLREQTSALSEDKRMLADSIADISHQIRTPLTTMNLIAAALRRPDTDAVKRQELLLELREQLERVDWLVSALLKLARFDADAIKLNPVELTLEELIRRSLEPLEIPMELRGQTVEKTVSGNIVCDPSWTAEALTNIIKNCSEHMGEGTLFIEASENPLCSEIVIRDSGPGVAPEDLPHLFERFYKGKNSGGSGVGIGLALCRTIVAGQNGSVKAENAKQGGAQFTVRIYKSTV